MIHNGDPKEAGRTRMQGVEGQLNGAGITGLQALVGLRDCWRWGPRGSDGEDRVGVLELGLGGGCRHG